MSTPINQLTETYFKNKTKSLENDVVYLLNETSVLIRGGKARNSSDLYSSIQNEILTAMTTAQSLKDDWDVWNAAAYNVRPPIGDQATQDMVDELDFILKVTAVVWGLAAPF